MTRAATLVMLAAAFGVAALVAALVARPADLLAGQARCDAPTPVASAEAFERALACVSPGATIALAAGPFEPLTIKNIAADRLTIRSADPARPAVLTGLTVRGSSGITLSGLAFDGQPTAMRYKLLVLGSSRITMDGLRFTGDAPVYDMRIVSAVMLRGSREVVFRNSTLAGYWHGISMLDLRGVEIADNVLRAMRTDAIRGGGVSEAVIRRNQMTDFAPAEGDHPDGIQLWSTRQREPGRNIRIEDNLVVRGNGGATQGVFVRDTHDKLPFENLTITGNLVVGGLYNGITVMGVTGALIADNQVLPAPDRASWIRVEKATGVTLRDNRAGRFVLKGGIVESGNRTVAAKLAPSVEITRWAAERNLAVRLAAPG